MRDEMRVERDLGLRELEEWEEELNNRLKKGEINILGALKELTEIKLSRSKLLAIRV